MSAVIDPNADKWEQVYALQVYRDGLRDYYAELSARIDAARSAAHLNAPGSTALLDGLLREYHSIERELRAADEELRRV